MNLSHSLLLVAAALPAPAQPVGQWVDGRFLCLRDHERAQLLDEENHSHLDLPRIPPGTGPDGRVRLAWPPHAWRGRFYCTVATRPADSRRRRFSLLRYEDGWVELACYEPTEPTGPVLLFPAAADRVLAVGSVLGQGATSPFLLLRPSPDGTLHPEAELPLLPSVMREIPELLRLPVMASLVLGGGFLTLVHRESGWFWTFDLQEGRFHRHGRLRPDVDPAMAAAPRTLPVVDSLQPLPDGRILIATLGVPHTLGSDGLAQLPEELPLLWLCLDPKTGVTRPHQPEGAPSTLRVGKPFLWRPMTDGRVCTQES